MNASEGKRCFGGGGFTFLVLRKIGGRKGWMQGQNEAGEKKEGSVAR